jgi:hypothetical protein
MTCYMIRHRLITLLTGMFMLGKNSVGRAERECGQRNAVMYQYHKCSKYVADRSVKNTRLG